LACIALSAEIVTPETANMKTVAQFRANQGTAPAHDDVTLEFASETKAAGAAGLPFPIKIQKSWMLVLGVSLTLLVLAGVAAALTLRAPAPTTGALSVETDPPGAEVRIDNAVRGTTPLTLNLAEGRYSLLVQRGSNSKQVNVEIAANATNSYHIEWAANAPLAAPLQTGSLSVLSDPPGSAVTVDGSSRGQTPLTIRDLTAGRHAVLVKSSDTTYQRFVEVEAGATASLVVGGAASATPSWGWISLNTPFPVQVQEAGRVVGTSEIERIMLPQGSHELDFVAAQFGFRQTAEVRISAGRGAPVSLTIPRVAMNINALPWAEVFIDGTRIGDTPLANVMETIGEHEIVFRHPQLGEKRQVARLTMRDSPRISVDMRTK
jgi:type IV secretory pathway protease TraF